MVNTQNVTEHTLQEIIIESDEQCIYEIDTHCTDVHQAGAITYRFVCKRDSTLTLKIVLTGNGVCTNRYEIVLQEEGAQATILGCCALYGMGNQTIELMQEHKAPRTTSYSLVHSAVTDKASFTHDGMISISVDGAGTDAALYNKNLLLSNNARALAQPSLEVHTNQVECKHGTATSRFDQEQLLYMQSRGISSDKAHELLLYGFFSQEFGLKQRQLNRIMHQLIKPA